ncbi:Nuclear receptor subfamily 2 group C member 1 [Frankliniella fusca]|uniref:Nuclear receptor subfamily 2 group C member 1 n=1 Tax=Frankliniella fusca TaxID=407009 RepID=A0AAE1LEF5_9NEOP|nr:Nuclear receptor subfamily 2 group C member 1 [Frankliniella fusca]
MSIKTEKGEQFCFVNDEGTVIYTTEENLRMWKFITSLAREMTGEELNPEVVLVDFEDAAHISIRECFPNASIHAHIHANSHLRLAFSKTDSEEGKWLHAFLGLSLLHPDSVCDGFLTLMEFKDTTWPSAFTEFADYVTDTYASDCARYPPELWAAPPGSGPRTTNAAESFHRHFNDQFRGAHPNIHHLTESLLDIQAGTYIKINSIDRKVAARCDPQVKERQERAKVMYGQFMNGEREMYSYLKIMGFMFKKK